jgi:acetylornithine/N-succinyldiaminopimelate aminotransferase
VPASMSFLKSITFLCDKYNVLLIIDEIQIGIGRTGKLFAYEYYNIKPDMLTLVKGLGGDFPISVSAMLTTEKIASYFTLGIHGTTYGGNLLACSLGEKILDFVNTSKVLSGVTDRHKYFLDKLTVINHRLKLFSEIRGKGLLIGLVLVKNQCLNVATILNFAAQKG